MYVGGSESQAHVEVIKCIERKGAFLHYHELYDKDCTT